MYFDSYNSMELPYFISSKVKTKKTNYIALNYIYVLMYSTFISGENK